MALSTMGTGSGRTAFFFPVGEDDVVKKGGNPPPFRSKICQRCEERKDPAGQVNAVEYSKIRESLVGEGRM
jgi:hypothetical protein